VTEQAPTVVTASWSNPFRRIRNDPALRREADMMGFYVAIALLVALTAGSDHSDQSQLDVLGIVWGTTLGLALAHWFALTVSARLVNDPDLHHTPTEMLLSQIVMAVAVALLATVVVLVCPTNAERLGARLTAALFVGLLVVVESRAGGATTQRALVRGAIALGVAFAIATIKWFVK
jgi:hypothetical protein